MISVRDEGIVLSKSQYRFESRAVCNPSCLAFGGAVHMLYRAVDEKNISSIGYGVLKDGLVVYRSSQPVLVPEYEYESRGVEDPRVVWLDGTYYLFYVAYDGLNALTAYATSSDFIHWQKQGLLSPAVTYDMVKEQLLRAPQGERYGALNEFHIDRAGGGKLLWQKDAFLFPQKIGGKFALLYRILPGMQIVYFNSFQDLTEAFWRDYFSKFGQSVVLNPEFPFESRYIGGGAPPVWTPRGWLLVNQGVEQRGGAVVYHATAALLDLQNPLRVIARLPYPLFSPDPSWSGLGQVHNVVFPSSALVLGGRLFVYHGVSDEWIGAKSVDLQDLLEELGNYSA